MIPAWAARFVGIPWRDGGRDFAGCDCYGLCYLVLREQFGVEIPSYAGAYVSAQEREEVSSMIAGHVLSDGWRLVADPRPGDGLILRVANRPWHVGLLVTPDDFVHIEEAGTYSVIEPRDSWRWRRRIIGTYRHRALA